MILTRSFRKPFWLVKSFFFKHKKLIGYAALLGACLVLFTKNLLPLILPKFKPQIRIGQVSQYTFNNLPPAITQVISRGLTKIDISGLPQPDLALKWEINSDETVYKIFLKPNNFWSDGTEIKTKDLAFDIPDIEFKAIDDYTLEFKLKEPYSPFLTVLSRPLFKNQTVGAGQYIIKSVHFSGPYLKSLELTGSTQNLIYKFYPSQESAWLGFRLGEIDRLENLLINPLDKTWQSKVKLTKKINNQQYVALIFNLSNPIFGQKNLRQALAYALENKSASADSRALSPISPDSWAYNSKVKPYDFSPVQAQDLYSKFSQDASISGQLKITLGTSQSFLDLAESIAASWEKVLHIQTEIKIVSSIEPDFQVLLITQEIPPDPDQHTLWHSTQDTNVTHYSDLKIDKLLEDGRKISDLTKRKEIYQDFQRFLVEDLPAIFLEHPTVYTISR
ncbi:MAG: ABC transporter substrate-binding protein [Candidatus Beckwithbacteria bacterium]|nr:ABC transporter substrate-binding protein [Candidatus Beckwithbacteria bacterium]